jgi:prevent-host-death family protein
MTGPYSSLSIQDFRTKLADNIAQVQYADAHIEVTKHGKPVAHVVSPEWFERAQAALAAAPQDAPDLQE